MGSETKAGASTVPQPTDTRFNDGDRVHHKLRHLPRARRRLQGRARLQRRRGSRPGRRGLPQRCLPRRSSPGFPRGSRRRSRRGFRALGSPRRARRRRRRDQGGRAHRRGGGARPRVRRECDDPDPDPTHSSRYLPPTHLAGVDKRRGRSRARRDVFAEGTRDGRRDLVFDTHETATSSSARAPTELDVSTWIDTPRFAPRIVARISSSHDKGRKTHHFSIPVPSPRNAGWRRLHHPPRPSQGW